MLAGSEKAKKLPIYYLVGTIILVTKSKYVKPGRYVIETSDSNPLTVAKMSKRGGRFVVPTRKTSHIELALYKKTERMFSDDEHHKVIGKVYWPNKKTPKIFYNK